jgi:hypothetical protein
MTKALDDVTGARTFNLTDYFTDTDVHDVLTYSLTVEDPNVVIATLVGSTLYVQNGLFRDGRSLITVTASDGFANVSSALNATYSFATVSFQFESEYVYVIKATSLDDSNTKQVFMRELVMYDASGAKIVYGLDSITASADAPSDGGSLSVLYDNDHTTYTRAAVYRHTKGADSVFWPLNTNLFTLTLPRAAKEIRMYFSHTSATTAGGFDIAISENGNDLGTSPRNDTNVYPSYWETNWELTGSFRRGQEKKGISAWLSCLRGCLPKQYSKV